MSGMDKVNPGNSIPPSLTERLQGFFATRDYVKAQVETVKRYAGEIKNYIVIHFTALLLAVLVFILAFVWYLHNDLKQEMQANKSEAKQERAEAKQERAEAKQERQELKQQMIELRALIESLDGIRKGKSTASKFGAH